jgi:hypothetical protein
MCRSQVDGGQRCAAQHPATRAVLAVQKTVHGFDDAQVRSVWAKACDRARPRATTPSPQQWQTYVD